MKALKFIGVVVWLALAAGSCKKGENDPFFSLKSRKARLSTDWTVETATVVTRDTSMSFDGTDAVLSSVQDSTADERTYGLTWTMSFTRDGDYEIVEQRQYPEGYFGDGSASITSVITELGTWQFTGGSGGAKLKEQLLLLPTETSITRSDQGANVNVTTQTNPNEGRIYNIDRLASDELILKYEVTHSSAFDQYVESAEINLKS